MNSPKTICVMMALLLSLLLIPAAQANVYAPQAPAAAYVELDAVATRSTGRPIALDPTLWSLKS